MQEQLNSNLSDEILEAGLDPKPGVAQDVFVFAHHVEVALQTRTLSGLRASVLEEVAEALH